MSAFTSAANTGQTEMELITQIVQTELIESAVIKATVSDFSNLVSDGLKSVEIPRFEADLTLGSGRLGDPDEQNPDGTTPVNFKTASFTTDKIELNKWPTLAYTVPDRIQIQSRVAVISEIAAKAGRELAIYMDKEIRDVMRTATEEVVFEDLAEKGMQLEDVTAGRLKLNRNNVVDSNRVLLISPELEKDILDLDNFRNANQYGAREALLNGEIGRIYGARVVVSNLLEADEAYMYHPECIAYAMQKSLRFEQQRADVRLQRDDYAFSAGWGLTMMYEGKKIVKYVASAGEGE